MIMQVDNGTQVLCVTRYDAMESMEIFMNRKYYFMIAVLAITLLSACAGPQFKWSDAGKIKSGMTTEEVTQIMGEPNGVSSNDGKLFYTWASRKMCKGSRAITIEFKENKVTEAPAIPSSFKD